MRDVDIGKRMVEEMRLEQVLESFPVITGREITDEWEGHFAQVELAPDFIVGFDGETLGIELPEIRWPDDAWTYYEIASQCAWKKHGSYTRRSLFTNPSADGGIVATAENVFSRVTPPRAGGCPTRGDDFKTPSLLSFYSPIGRGRIDLGHFTVPCVDESSLICENDRPFVRAASPVRVPSHQLRETLEKRSARGPTKAPNRAPL